MRHITITKDISKAFKDTNDGVKSSYSSYIIKGNFIVSPRNRYVNPSIQRRTISLMHTELSNILYSYLNLSLYNDAVLLNASNVNKCFPTLSSALSMFIDNKILYVVAEKKRFVKKVSGQTILNPTTPLNDKFRDHDDDYYQVPVGVILGEKYNELLGDDMDVIMPYISEGISPERILNPAELLKMFDEKTMLRLETSSGGIDLLKPMLPGLVKTCDISFMSKKIDNYRSHCLFLLKRNNVTNYHLYEFDPMV